MTDFPTVIYRIQKMKSACVYLLIEEEENGSIQWSDFQQRTFPKWKTES